MLRLIEPQPQCGETVKPDVSSQDNDNKQQNRICVCSFHSNNIPIVYTFETTIVLKIDRPVLFLSCGYGPVSLSIGVQAISDLIVMRGKERSSVHT